MVILGILYQGANWYQQVNRICKKRLHIRDWSEVFVVVAAIASLRIVIQSSPKNLNALIKNPHFTLFVVLSGIEVRIRQLWINYSPYAKLS